VIAPVKMKQAEEVWMMKAGKKMAEAGNPESDG
jgi:hypothetical protein